MKYENFYVESKEGKSNCVIRTFNKLFGLEYDTIFNELVNLSKELNCSSFNDVPVFENYLNNHHFLPIETDVDTKIKDLKLSNNQYVIFCWDKKDDYHMIPIINNVIYDKNDRSLEMYPIVIYELKTKNLDFISLLPIKTDRLTIDKTTTKDVDFLLKTDKQEETQKYLGGIKNKTKEERIEFLKNKEDIFTQGIASSLTVLLPDNTPVGLIGLKIDDEKNEAEISYLFDYDYWHNGYCTEAVNKLIDIAFNNLKLNRIFANTIIENINSIKVLERTGFIKESQDDKFSYYSIYREGE